MTPWQDPQTGQWWLVDAGGRKIRRVTVEEAQAAQAAAPTAVPTPPPGATPVPTGRRSLNTTAAEAEADLPALSDDQRRELGDWNDAAKEIGVDTISQADARRSLAYMDAVNVPFDQALNLYANFMAGRHELGPDEARSLAAVSAISPMAGGPIRAVLRAFAGSPTGTAGGGLPSGAGETAVGQAILAVTGDPQVQAAMWAGANVEGGVTGPFETAPGGSQVGGAGEVGPWQIHPIHFDSITPEAAADPNSAALFMLPRYEDSVKSVPAELWQTDPGGALMLATANAERPAGWHEGLTVDEAVGIYGGRPEGAAGLAPAAFPEGEAEAITVTDKDRLAVLNAGLDLSDSEIKQSKLMRISFEDYATLKDLADKGGLSLPQAWARIQGGTSFEEILTEGRLTSATSLVQAAKPGTTEAEARTYATAAVNAGLEPEEAAYGYKNNLPPATLGDLKRQVDEVVASTADPRNVPTVREAIEGWSTGVTPFQIAQQKEGAAEAAGYERQFATVAKQMGKTPQEVHNIARTLGRGDITAGFKELQGIRARKRLPGEAAAAYAQRRFTEGATAREVQRGAEAQFPESERQFRRSAGVGDPAGLGLAGRIQAMSLQVTRRGFTSSGVAGAYDLGGTGGDPGRRTTQPAAKRATIRTAFGEIMYGQRMREAFIHREQTTGLRGGEGTRGQVSVGIPLEEGGRPRSLVERFPELSRRVEEERGPAENQDLARLSQMTTGPAAPTAPAADIIPGATFTPTAYHEMQRAGPIRRTTALGTEDAFAPGMQRTGFEAQATAAQVPALAEDQQAREDQELRRLSQMGVSGGIISWPG